MQENIVELSFENGVSYKMYVPFKESDFIQKQVFNTKKPYEYEMLSHILTQIPKNSTVLDIGMNIANHSLFFAANGFKIHAFEANTKMSEIAKESIRLNHFEDRIKIYEFGVSDREEKAYFAKEMPWNFGGMSLSIITENSEEISDFIECRTIDSFDIKDKIALIKIDIEGMEAKALKGAEKLIAKNRPLIYAEANYVHDFVKLDRILSEFSYVHWDIFGGSPTHLYYPLEKLNSNEILTKSLSNQALLRLYFTTYKHNNFTHNTLSEISKTLLEPKKQNLQRDKELHKKAQELKHIKNTLTYRWGKSLLESSKSLCKILILPYTLLKDYREFKLYLKNKK